MTDQQNNRVLHELFGKCWHEPHRPDLWEYYRCRHCKREYSDTEITYAEYGNPDYAADPRLVLEGMKYASNFQAWLDSMVLNELPNLGMIKVDLILDRTGRLRDLAIEFLKEEGK